MQKEIEAFKSIKEEEADKVLRIQAEFQNYKRRKDEETDRMIKFANEGLIESILPTLDNFERAISLDDSNLTDELSKFLEGFKMVYTSFVGVLDNFGLKEINAIDEPFDPTYHQAVLTDKDDTKEDGIVLEVLQKGYMLKDRVIRASMVKVNNL
jgi:molecular chaperone GrpE